MIIKDGLTAIFQARTAGPYLFVGSGFSRRYLGLEDWRGLLTRFCQAGRPFEYYVASADGDLATVAKLLANDFNEHWWKSEDYQRSVARYKSKVKDVTSALRIEICDYILSLDQSKALESEHKREVELLSGLNVDGVITTNWDTFLEQLFPDYKTYIGQKELLFSNPQEIGEIYKIHGCASKPDSLILTKDDYVEFNNRNAYLAAKLITIFVEHPVVFIGYSISDENISALLRAIAACIGKDNIEKLRRNLIFIQRLDKDEAPGISDTYLSVDGVQIPLVLVRTDNFAEVYEAIDATKRKIPARVLRYCKEQLYELVKSSSPEEKICVVDIDEIDSKEDVEFLVGVGVASQEASGPSPVGYASLGVRDLIEDLLLEDRDYDAEQVLRHVIPRLCKSTPYVPTFRYLSRLNINSAEAYESLNINLEKVVNKEIKSFRLKNYSRPFFRHYRHMAIGEIINSCTPENASAYIPFLAREKIDLAALKNFLVSNIEKVDYSNSSYASSFRKLAALYDRLKWGW